MGTSKILLVDDDRTVIAVVGSLLSDAGQTRFATSGVEALRIALRWVPDLVLLDVEMPEMNGYEVCRIMKQNPVLQDVPVIFLTSHDDPDQEITGLGLGASDFIGKPPRGPVVLARVRSQLRLREIMGQLQTEATTDPLTGMLNRRRFEEIASHEWNRAQRTGSPTALLMVDVDFFKAYNDRYGHPEGDTCLQRVAGELQQGVHRPADLVARLGGEEFAVLLPETNGSGALAVATHLCTRIDNLRIAHAGSRAAPHVTVSIGASAYDTTCPGWVGAARSAARDSGRPRPPLSALIASADRALYRAKQAGRRRAMLGRLGDDDGPDGESEADRELS